MGRVLKALGEEAKLLKLIINVCPVLLREQILEQPKTPKFREDYAAVPILVEALLKYAAAQIVDLTFQNFPNGLAKFVVSDARLPSRLGEPGGFEGTRGLLSISHESNVALSAIKIKIGILGLAAVVPRSARSKRFYRHGFRPHWASCAGYCAS
jgi:hypothetical protein